MAMQRTATLDTTSLDGMKKEGFFVPFFLFSLTVSGYPSRQWGTAQQGIFFHKNNLVYANHCEWLSMGHCLG